MSFKTVVIGALIVATGCTTSEPVSPNPKEGPMFLHVPAAGNKIVTPIDFTLPGFTACPNGTVLDLHIVGWFQDRPGGEPANQPGVVDFYFDFIYSNAAGETYVWHQVGSEVFRLNENGDIVFSVNGRTLDEVGRIIINGATGELTFVAGRQPYTDNLACAALT